MADWKTQINFNYSSSYHGYHYSLLCQSGAEQNQVPSWGEPEVADSCNNNYTPNQTSYNNSGHGQYQGTGLVYDAGQLIMTGQARENMDRPIGSECASDSEPQTSPDSWCSGISVEGGLPQADPATWILKTNLEDETSSTSPDSTGDVNRVKEEPHYCIIGGEGSNTTTIGMENTPPTAPKTQGTMKGKVRAAFSETQMAILTQRFNMQQYLTPAEMKNMAEITGLTYKQVKTWFQNRRMKLRRHQKENGWASERYAINRDSTGHGAGFTNISGHIQPYQGQAKPSAKEHYNAHMIEAALRKTTPQNLALYLAAVGGENGSGGYSTWPTNVAQGTVNSRAQAPGWPLTSEPHQFGYSDRFNTQNHGPATGFKEGEQVNHPSHNPIALQSPAQ